MGILKMACLRAKELSLMYWCHIDRSTMVGGKKARKMAQAPINTHKLKNILVSGGIMQEKVMDNMRVSKGHIREIGKMIRNMEMAH